MLKAGTAARRQSLRGGEPLSPDELRRGVEHFLERLDQRLQERDPNWVGHCKLLVAGDGATAYASIAAAGERPRWASELHALDRAELTIYVALYGWSDGDVARALDGALGAEPVLSFVSSEF